MTLKEAMRATSPVRFRRALLATVLSVLTAMPAKVFAQPAAFAPAPAVAFAPLTASRVAFAPAAVATAPKYSQEAYESLKALIDGKELQKMDLDFFKEVYRHEHAPEMLKLMFSSGKLEAKSRALAELRKFYTLTLMAEWARANHVLIEITNQGKDNGSRSDLDLTANVLELDPATGEWVLGDKAVESLIDYVKTRMAKEGLTFKGTDVTLFNGETWLPDWRNGHQSYEEFTRQLTRGAWEAMHTPEAYSVPGANKEQTHDRPMREGRTSHVGYDHAAGRVMVNGFAIELQPSAEGPRIVALEYDKKSGGYKAIGPLVELSTRDEAGRGKALRYKDLQALLPRESWRRALGNVVENAPRFLKEKDPISRNKYFIERIIDQGAGRFTDLEGAPSPLQGPVDPDAPATYVQIEAAPIDAAEKAAWKKSFIQQAFGLADGDARIGQIQSVLDRSAEIQLGKTAGHGSYEELARHSAGDRYYYRDEWAKAVDNTAEAARKLQEKAAEGEDVSEKIVRLQEHEAERLFVEKQRRIIVEAGIQMVKETFKRDFPVEMKARRDTFADPEAARKIMFERGHELARLMHLIESSPEVSPVLREKLRAAVLAAIPQEFHALVAKLVEINRLKMGLFGSLTGGRTGQKNISELNAEVAQEYQRLFGSSGGEGPAIPDDRLMREIHDAISTRLGPVDGPKFEAAWKEGKARLVARFARQAYVKEIVEQADAMMMAGAAMGLINAYQQNCINQTSWNEQCVTGLAAETGNQIVFLLPGVNTGWMIYGGLKSIKEGKYSEGVPSLALGVCSLPSVAEALGAPAAMFIHIYIGIQMVSLGVAVTYGYAVQTMENDAVEQAFKSLREPAKHARPFLYPGRSANFDGDTPNVPLLADVITGKDKNGQELVPADGWSDAERNHAAFDQFGASIEAELKQQGIQPDSPQWESKKAGMVAHQAALLPYMQRTANIYRVFGPKVEAKARELGKDQSYLIPMQTCLEVRQGDIEKEYQAPPSLWDQVKFWKDRAKEKQNALAEAWSTCVDRVAKDDEGVLGPVFDEYLDGWLGQQEGSAHDQYAAPAMRARLRNALIHEYVVHRHLDESQEAEEQMKKSLAESRQAAQARLQLMGKILGTEAGLEQAIEQKLKQAAESQAPPAPRGVKPELTLRAPPFAVRVGEDAHIDFAAKGEYAGESKGDDEKRNEWTAAVRGELVKRTLGQPDNLIMTKELAAELQPQPGHQPKQFVTIDEKLTGELRDQTGQVVAKAETTVRYYDLVEWDGRIEVETRAAGPNTKSPADATGTFPYPGAVVRLSGPSEGEQQSAGPAGSPAAAIFQGLPEGKFSIHVEPRAGDKEHRAADATATLAGISSLVNSTGARGGGQPAGVKDRESVVVVLPYTATKEAVKPPGQDRPPLPEHAAAPDEPAPGLGRVAAGDTAGAGPSVADCNALVDKANAALAQNDPTTATSLLGEAQRASCNELAGVVNRLNTLADGITKANNELHAQIQQLLDGISQQTSACEYEKALALAHELSGLDPEAARAVLGQLEPLAAAQSQIRGLLSAVDSPMAASDAQATLAELQDSLAKAPACMVPQINAAIQKLQGGTGQEDLTAQIRALVAACDYVKAAAAAQQLQAIAPADPWLAANLGQLQAIAAAQAATQTLLRAAQQAAPGQDVSALLTQLRAATETAPSCLADQIQAAIARLEGLANQKPAWLDNGTSQPASDHTPDDSINRARDILNANTTDEVNQQLQRDAQARQAQQKPPDAAPADAPPPAAQPQQTRADDDNRRRQNAQRRAAAISGILQSLTGALGGRAGIPSIPSIPSIPRIPSGGEGGAAQGRDPFAGTWVGYGAVTAFGKGRDEDKGSVVNARTNPRENQIVFMISKSGSGYAVQGPDGTPATVRYVRGNQMGLALRYRTGDGRSATVSGDYSVNGNGMTGTQRADGEDGSYMVMSVTLNRQ